MGNNRTLIKTIFATAFFISFCQVLFAQQKTEVYYGESGRNDFVKDIVELYDNGYYVSGGFESGDGTYKGWGIKTDINLEMVYDKVIEHTLGDVAISSTISDSNGNIYITGLTPSDNLWPSVFKIDSCGNKVWCKLLDYSDEFNFGYGYDIILTDNDEVVVLAYLLSDDQVDMTHLIGLNTEGDVLWKKSYASKNDYPWIDNAIGYSITETDNSFYISGKCYWPYPDDTTNVFLRPLFIGIDSLFNEKWILPFYALDSVYGKAYTSIPLNDSVFMGVGIRRLPESKDNSLLMFYNKYGEELGFNEITNEQIGPDINSNHIREIKRINDTLFISGSLFGPDFSENPGGEFIIDTAANLYNFESRPNTKSPELIKTSDNKFIFATSIAEGKGNDDIYVYKIDENLNDVPFDPTPHNYDSLCPGGIQSGITDLTDCLVWTNIGDAPSPAEYYESVKWVPIRAWPNPSGTGQVSFGFENTGYFSVGAAASAPPSIPPGGGKYPTLAIFNIVGEKVHIERIYRHQEETTVNVQSCE
jgi:hypothetical protein